MIGVRQLVGTTSWAGFMWGATRHRFFSIKNLTPPSSVTIQWQPDASSAKTSNLTQFANQMATKHGLAPFTALDLSDYNRLHRWSVENPSEFWRGVWDHVGFVGEYRHDAIVEPGNAAWAAQGNPSPRWFPGASVNHAENLLAHGRDSDTALIFASETSHELQLVTYKQLRSKVGRLAAALAVEGVGPGDCCAGYVSNTPDAVVAMLAVTSLGASFATVSPDFGERGASDRLGQVAPKVLFVHDCYYYRGKRFDMAPKVNSVARELASTKRIIVLDYPLEPSGTGTLPALSGAVRLQDYIAGHEGAPLIFRRGPFDRAVYIMFSSGTTGAPKCMVQGCGVTLNHSKEAGRTLASSKRIC
jgi:acetoacetyl-CoA synthetase